MQISLPKRLLSWIYALNDFGTTKSTMGSCFSSHDLENARSILVK